MEGDGKLELKTFCCQSLDSRYDAAGADGDVPRANVQSLLFVEDLQRAQHVVVVVERFAHSHDDDVGRTHERAVLHCQQANALHHLSDDFSGRQVAALAELSAGAKCAAECTSRLRGNTLRHTSLGRNQNRFDLLAVRRAGQQQFVGSISRGTLLHELHRLDRNLLRQLRAQGRGQRCKCVPTRFLLTVKPFHDLVGTEFRELSHLGHFALPVCKGKAVRGAFF